MMKRKSLSRRKSRRVFSKTARRVHKKNSFVPMRGGIRL